MCFDGVKRLNQIPQPTIHIHTPRSLWHWETYRKRSCSRPPPLLFIRHHHLHFS